MAVARAVVKCRVDGALHGGRTRHRAVGVHYQGGTRRRRREQGQQLAAASGQIAVGQGQGLHYAHTTVGQGEASAVIHRQATHLAGQARTAGLGYTAVVHVAGIRGKGAGAGELNSADWARNTDTVGAANTQCRAGLHHEATGSDHGQTAGGQYALNTQRATRLQGQCAIHLDGAVEGRHASAGDGNVVVGAGIHWHGGTHGQVRVDHDIGRAAGCASANPWRLHKGKSSAESCVVRLHTGREVQDP